jgi:hypothetical protein
MHAVWTYIQSGGIPQADCVELFFFEFSPGDYSHLNIFKKGQKRQIYRSFEEEKQQQQQQQQHRTS